MNRGNDDFEELEPRATPRPTVLKCLSAPSVPEVSILFGKRPEPPQHPQQHRQPTKSAEAEYETYASWKKDEFPGNAEPRNALRLFDKSADNGSPLVHRKSAPSDLENFNGSSAKFHESPRQIVSQHNRQSQNRNGQSPARITDNLRGRNYEPIAYNEISAYPLTNKLADSPHQKKYDVVKSILKSSQFERSEAVNSSASPDRRSQRKNPLQIGQTARNVVTDFSRSAVSSRGNRQIDATADHGTVQDLLLLVQSQNEQIRTLQNQVERLLKAHEESLINRETRVASATRKSADFTHSPIVTAADNNGRGNREIPGKSTKKSADFLESTDFPRSADFSPISRTPHATNEQPDARLCHQGEPIRNAIVEQKVSIGVMTSFEFSVHNNPFDTDHQQINAVFRECGTYGDVGTENRRRNVAPILTGALENINEDSESHPSSVQLSSNSKRNSGLEDVRSCEGNRQNRPIFRANESSNFADKSAQPPVPAPRKLSVNSRDRRFSGESAAADFRAIGAADREARDVRRVQDRNDYNRQSSEVFADVYTPEIGRFSGNPGFPEVKSTAENTDEASLVLNSSELRVNDRAPSPDPSIHVEMREYSSDDENEKSKQAPKVGWTFYKNIVGQVNRILHTIPDAKDAEDNEERVSEDFRAEVDGRDDVDPVKLATLERLKMLGISFAEHSEFMGEHVQKKVTFDSSYCPRLDYPATLPQPASSVTESNTSMHMKALALKYLSDEQLADLAVQKQNDGTGVKHKILNSVHATNMSLATMNYLQRYCLVSGVNSPHAEGKGQVNAIRQKKMKHVVMTKELHAQPSPRHNGFNDSTSGKPDNILDITTLKQQPKLL